MNNTSKMNISPYPAVIYSKLTENTTRGRHQANDGKSGSNVDGAGAHQGLRSLRSNKKPAVERQQDTHFIRNEKQPTSIGEYVNREAAVARKWVQVGETAIMQEQKDTWEAENAQLRTREPERMFQEMLVAIVDSPGDLASSVDVEHRDSKLDEDKELGKLRDDDEPGRKMRIISNIVHQLVERAPQKQMILDKLTQLG